MKPLTNENPQKLYQLTNEKRENLREMTRQVLQKGSFKYQKIGLKLLGKTHKALEYFCQKKSDLVYACTMKSKHKMEDCVKTLKVCQKPIILRKKINTLLVTEFLMKYFWWIILYKRNQIQSHHSY